MDGEIEESGKLLSRRERDGENPRAERGTTRSTQGGYMAFELFFVSARTNKRHHHH